MSSLAVAALAFIPGLAVGSFLTVVAARVPARRSVVSGRSECPSCGAQIAWYHNVPVVSYLLLRGRCRHCGERIGRLYPAIELATALLVAGCFWRFGFSWDALIAAFFAAVLVAISSIDIEHRIVPNRVVLPAAGVVLAARTLTDPSFEWVIAGFAAALFLLAAALVYPGGMGMGDVKLALLLGFAVGSSVAVAIAAALLSALIPSLALIVRHGSKARKMAIPFAPFLALGGLLALYVGDALVDSYLNLL